eukprot:scaffold82160_cov47-Phaeocystis_antarctica.AAC.2
MSLPARAGGRLSRRGRRRRGSHHVSCSRASRLHCRPWSARGSVVATWRDVLAQTCMAFEAACARQRSRQTTPEPRHALRAR